MSTVIRPELSQRNKYYISKNRYYELKHFCLQYYEWKKAYNDISLIPIMKYETRVTNSKVDTTCELVAKRELYFVKMKLVEDSAKECDDYLGKYIFKAVTEGLSFTYFKSRLDVACSRDFYYDRYHKFFYILDHKLDNSFA